jgi:hypothetical protein
MDRAKNYYQVRLNCNFGKRIKLKKLELLMAANESLKKTEIKTTEIKPGVKIH